MAKLVDFMLQAIAKREDESAMKALHDEVKAFCLQYPVPGITAEECGVEKKEVALTKS